MAQRDEIVGDGDGQAGFYGEILTPPALCDGIMECDTPLSTCFKRTGSSENLLEVSRAQQAFLGSRPHRILRDA